ncbi:MAG: SHOCT domain-containing protein [Defluviitaleaceae bacterium]|nr:SHOCT domain-containing protein [Defluviitaleaceae bacterium]
MEELIFYAIAGVGYLVWMLISFFLESSKEKERRAREAELDEIAAKEVRAKVAKMESQVAKIQPAIKQDIPSSPGLAAYMQDLPQKVKGVADARRLAAKLETDCKMGLWQNAVVRVIALIKPNEFIYAMTWNAHCVTLSRNEAEREYKESHGVVFFSNMRFLHFKDPANIIEFPLNDIYTVEAHKGNYFDGISFRTPTLHVQLSFAGAIDRKLFRDMVIHIAASAACPSFTEGMSESNILPQICECPGCGATVIIHADIKNKCDFCGRLVGKQEVQTTSNSVADEIKKYKELMDKGILSEQEFEKAKGKLLSKL